jgi:hypothetical protein
VIRRSYSSGEKPVVAIMPDRLVVLKESSFDADGTGGPVFVLPWSPQPTQDEVSYDELVAKVESHLEDIDRLAGGGEMDELETRSGSYPDYTEDRSPERREYWLYHYRRWLRRDQKKLADVCVRLGMTVPAGLERTP